MGYVWVLFVVAAGAALVAGKEEITGLRLVKPIHSKGDLQDQNSAETGFGGGGGGGVEGSKYFQEIYMLQSGPQQIEFGHVCESPDDWEQRYEKKDFEKNRHQGKVRWADKKGGHGEHYWDYNHAGHGGDDDGEGGYSDPVPSYTPSQSANVKSQQKRQLEEETNRRFFNEQTVQTDLKPQATRHYVEEQKARRHYYEPKEAVRQIYEPRDTKPQESRFYGEESEPKSDEGFVGTFEDEVGGVENFDIQKESSKQKRNPEAQRASKKVDTSLFNAQRAGQEIQNAGQPQLYFDLESGKVIDENTGKTYLLQPYSA